MAPGQRPETIGELIVWLRKRGADDQSVGLDSYPYEWAAQIIEGCVPK